VNRSRSAGLSLHTRGRSVGPTNPRRQAGSSAPGTGAAERREWREAGTGHRPRDSHRECAPAGGGGGGPGHNRGKVGRENLKKGLLSSVRPVLAVTRDKNQTGSSAWRRAGMNTFSENGNDFVGTLLHEGGVS